MKGSLISNKTIVLTRVLDDSLRIANILQKQGYDSFIEPLIKIKYIDSSKKLFLENFDNQLIIVTSANALRFLSNINLNKTIKIICVGIESAKIANNLGYHNTKNASGNSESLLKYIIEHYDTSKRIIYPCAKVLSFDLTKELTLKGYKIKQIPVYESIAVDDFSSLFKEKLKNGEFDTIRFYSKFTAQTFMHLIKQNKFGNYLPNIKISCISSNVANVFDGKFLKKITLF